MSGMVRGMDKPCCWQAWVNPWTSLQASVYSKMKAVQSSCESVFAQGG